MVGPVSVLYTHFSEIWKFIGIKLIVFVFPLPFFIFLPLPTGIPGLVWFPTESKCSLSYSYYLGIDPTGSYIPTCAIFG